MKLLPKSYPRAAFTMVEIAISVGVIAFALVAIIGLLPTGMQTRKENREDTLINQEGSYWIEAIRNGAEGMVDLSAYVDDVDGIGGLRSREIIGLLSSVGNHAAIVRAINGPAALKSTESADLAFRYRLVSHVTNFVTLAAGENPEKDRHMSNSLWEVRLALSWPLLPNGQLSAQPSRQVFRTLVSGAPTNELTSGGLRLMFFRSNQFTNYF